MIASNFISILEQGGADPDRGRAEHHGRFEIA
jgi:hypothetical protein